MKQTAVAFLAFGVIAAAFLRAFDIATHLAQTSDSVQSFVAGHAVIRGNVFLSGWRFPFDNYYVTDTIPYAALEWMTGPCPFLLALEPAIAYVLFVCFALSVSLHRGQKAGHELRVVAATALLIASPSWIGNWNPLLMSDLHFATVLLALVALWICAGVAKSGQNGLTAFIGQCTGLMLLVSATVASDPFSVVFAFAPALAVLGAAAAFGRPRQRACIALLLLAGGMALGSALLALTAQAGGFTTESHVVTGFIPAHLIGRNLIALAIGIVTLAGANLFATGFTLPAVILFAVHATALVLCLIAVVAMAGGAVAKHGTSLLDRFLCAGIFTVLVACAASAQFGKGLAAATWWMGEPPMRYVMPALLFACLLACRQIPAIIDRIEITRRRAVATGALTLFAVTAIVAGAIDIPEGTPRWISNNPPALVANWLKKHGLIQGVGEYWAANLITAMSSDSIHVRSVVADAGKLVPYVWSSSASGYAQPPQFAIWQDKNLTGLTYGDVRATYAICRTTEVGDYRIAVLATPAKRHRELCGP